MSTILTVGTPFQFEPNPPGPAGTRPTSLLSSNYSTACALFNDGTLKMLMVETFGYSVLELSNPTSPQVIKWDYMPFSQNMAIHGDGQSYIAAMSVSEDGQRTAFSCTGPGEQWNTVFAVPDGGGGFTVQGQANVRGAVFIRKYGSRYICYHLNLSGFKATDITNLDGGPIEPYGGSMPLDTIYSSAVTDGFFIQNVGKYALWSQSLGGIRVVDLSNPGPIGNIGTNFKTTEITGTDPYFGGRGLGIPRCWYDATNNKIWLLFSLKGRPGVNRDAFGLCSITQDPITGNFAAPTYYGQVFDIPRASGETWYSDFSSSMILPKNGSTVLLCAVENVVSAERGFYAFTTDTWGTSTDYVSVPISVFSASSGQYINKNANSIYYYSTNGAAYVTEFGFTLGVIITEPTNIAVSSITSNSASLTGTPSASIGTGTGHYNIYLTKASTRITTTLLSTIAPYFPFVLTGLSSSTDYSVQVSLTDTSSNESPKSSVVTFSTPSSGGGGGTTPTPPSNVISAVGASPDAINVTWSAPTTPNGTLDNYLITNKITGTSQTIPSNGTLSASLSALSYGITYTFGVKAHNENGYSPETISNVLTLVAPVNLPSAPTGVNVAVTPTGTTTVTWGAPINVGSGPITGYKVILNNNKSIIPITFTLGASTFSQTITGLAEGTTYYFSIAATNTVTAPYIYGTEAISISFDPATFTLGKALVKTSFNYTRFFEAPIVLDSTKLNYGDFLYPETVTSTALGSITTDNIVMPLNIIAASGTQALYFWYQAVEDIQPIQYRVIIPNNSYSDFTTFVDAIQAQITNNITGYNKLDISNSLTYPFIVTGISDDITGINTIMFTATGPTVMFTLNDAYISTGYTNVNNQVFGLNPVLFDGYEEPLVENHIPTAAYDNLHNKSLVESMPIVTRKDLVVNYRSGVDIPAAPYIEVDSFDGKQYLYKMTIDNVPLRPNKVDIFWYNTNNEYTHLVDYRGTGVLFEKIRTIDEFGNTVYTYEPEDTTVGYGTVDYAHGFISKILLKNYRPASVLGKGAVFPLNVYGSTTVNGVAGDNLVLNVRGSYQNFFIPKGIYSAESIVNYLNSVTTGLPAFKLKAGYLNGQVFIVNNVVGPAETLSAFGAPAGSLTLPIFGFKPIEVTPPTIYTSYSYSLNQKDPYQYIWYQTPHFVIRVHNKAETSLFTQAHLTYILNKIDRLRPATTVLDSINVTLEMTDGVSLGDNLDILVYPRVNPQDPPITYPYIIVDIMPAVGSYWPLNQPDLPALVTPGVNDITIMNPDEQQDIKVGGYTYI